MTSPEASSKPPEKPADAPPSGAALSDKARMKLEKQLQTQENKLQRLLAKSEEIASIEALRKVIEKETLFEPAIACLKKQAGIAAELRGVIDPKSFMEKAERLGALEKVFIKNLANGNASAVAAGELHKKFTDALSPTKSVEQTAVSPDAHASAAPAAASSPEPVKTTDVPARPTAVNAESSVSAGAKPAKSAEVTLPPKGGAPAVTNSEQAKPAAKQNGSGNDNRTRPTILERVQNDAKGFEQGIAVPLAPAGAGEVPLAKADTPSQKKVEQQTGAKKANETAPRTEKPPRVVKSSGSQDALARIIRDVEKSGVLKRRRGTGEITVRGGQIATEIKRLLRIFESEEFNEKSAAERERTIRESVELLTTNEQLRRDLLSAFEQKGWLTKSDKAEPNTKREEVEKKTVPASPDAALLQPPPMHLEAPAANAEQPTPPESAKEKSAEVLLHQVLTDVGRVPVGETIPRRMPDGNIVGISGKDMAAELQKVIKTYQTLEFPKKTLKERREIVLRDIDNTTSHPRLRADLERAFAAKGWLPQVVEPAKTAVETKTTEPAPAKVEAEAKKAAAAPIPPKPSVPSRTEAVPPKPPVPKSTEVSPVPSRGGGERSDLSPDLRSDLKEPPPAATIPLIMTRDMERQLASQGLSQETINKLKPEEAWKILNIGRAVKTSGAKTEVTPLLPPTPIAERIEVPPKPSEKTEASPVPEKAKTQSSLAELIRARAQGSSAPVAASLKEPFVEKMTPPPAVPPTVERAPSIPPATPAEKTEAPQPAKTGPSLAELLRERARGGAKKEFAPMPVVKPSEATATFASKPPEAVSASKPAEVSPVPSRGGGERSDLSPDLRSDLEEPPPVPKGPTPEQQKALTFENLATWSKEDLTKLAAAVPDEAVWAVALQGMTTSALEKAVQAALPPERVDNFALEVLTMPIKTKPEIEAKQQFIIAKAQELLAAKTDRKSE